MSAGPRGISGLIARAIAKTLRTVARALQPKTPAKSLPLSSLSNSFRRLGNLTLRKDCGAWLTLRFDGDVAMA